MKVCLAAASGTVTARFHLLTGTGRSYYYQASIPTTGATGYDISVLAAVADPNIIVADIVGADLIYSSGTLYANTSGSGGALATATVPTSTTGKQINAVVQTNWVSFGQVA